ncbi:MAG: hypothetical protein OEM52_06905 [bacterium]|nr:hypothetical protein [bacterium]
MNRKVLILITASLMLTVISLPSFAKPTAYGTVYAEGYGYQVPLSGDKTEDHLWLTSGVSSTLKGLPMGIQFKSHFQYRGDNQDKFAESGDMRLYSAYLTYCEWGSPLEINLGRFYAYRGVAFGLLDGLEVSHQATPWFGWAVLGGNNGPDNRRFEMARGSSPFLGAELRFRQLKPLWKHENSQLRLTYVNQKRDGNEFRNLVGVQLYTRYNKNWSDIVTVQLNPSSGLLRMANWRERHYNSRSSFLVELGVINPEVAADSWFQDFELESSFRARGELNYFLIPGKFGIGIEGTGIASESASSWRGGPVITTEYGQIGYRASDGDLSQSAGPWAALRYNFGTMVQTYMNTSISEYSWDEVALTDGTIVTANAGARYTPKRWQWMTVGAEYQYYKTPQLTSDKRALANVEFRFTTGGGK